MTKDQLHARSSMIVEAFGSHGPPMSRKGICLICYHQMKEAETMPGIQISCKGTDINLYAAKLYMPLHNTGCLWEIAFNHRSALVEAASDKEVHVPTNPPWTELQNADDGLTTGDPDLPEEKKETDGISKDTKPGT